MLLTTCGLETVVVVSSLADLEVVGINHVGLPARDLEASLAFYTELGLQQLPSFTFASRVLWLALGKQQLHLIESEGVPRSPGHVALVVDDFNAALQWAERSGCRVREVPLFAKVSRLPDGSAQLFVRDPAGNIIELLHPDADQIDCGSVPEVTELSSVVPQDNAAFGPRLFLDARPSSTARTASEVFAHHGATLVAADIEGLVSDYAEEATLLTSDGPSHGTREIRTFFAGLLERFEEPAWREISTVVDGDVVLHEWGVRSASGEVAQGVDTFVIRDGLIRVQTVRYALT